MQTAGFKAKSKYFVVPSSSSYKNFTQSVTEQRDSFPSYSGIELICRASIISRSKLIPLTNNKPDFQLVFTVCSKIAWSNMCSRKTSSPVLKTPWEGKATALPQYSVSRASQTYCKILHLISQMTLPCLSLQPLVLIMPLSTRLKSP